MEYMKTSRHQSHKEHNNVKIAVPWSLTEQHQKTEPQMCVCF